MTKRRRRDLQVRPPPPASVRGLTSKVRLAIKYMARDGMVRSAAAEAAGLKDNSLWKAFKSPIVRQYFHNEVEGLRTAEAARNIFTGVAVRDDITQPGKTRIDAAKFLSNVPERSVQINVGVGVQVQPGYIVDISKHRDRAAEILRQSGSKQNALEAGYSIIEGKTST